LVIRCKILVFTTDGQAGILLKSFTVSYI